MTYEWALVVAGHVDYRENGAPVGELDSVAGCDLRTAVQPEEREVRSRGGAGQTDGASRLRQVCGVGSYHNIGDFRCG